ncbi:PNPLA4, partial [Cervus elaphus hippelaphus]
MPHINLSFAACGFLGVYHLGAASALCKHGRKLLKDVKAFAGASAGSLVASVLLTAPQKIEECNKFTYDFAEEIRRQTRRNCLVSRFPSREDLIQVKAAASLVAGSQPA